LARKQAPAALARQAAALSSPDAVGGALGLREKMLELAGVTEAEQARLTRVAITRLTEEVSAEKVQRLVVNRGLNNSEVVEFVDIDWSSRHRAAAELLDRFGVVVSKSAQNVNNIGNLTVIVTKRDAPEVIEAELVQPVEVLPNPAS
jgi:site-specific recombinase